MKTELRKLTFYVDVPAGGLYVDQHGIPLVWPHPQQYNPPAEGATRYAFTVELPVQAWPYAPASEPVPISSPPDMKTEGRT